jgi:glycine betaine/choline ABC-type transport system substrate-binding protein
MSPRRAAWAALAVLLALAGCGGKKEAPIVVGSKNFSEQVVLGELLAQQIETQTPLEVDRRFFLGGTYVAHQALISGRVDVYVEYTGTALTVILNQPVVSDAATAFQQVKDGYAAKFGLHVAPSLGFENTFAMVIRGQDARKLNLRTLSDAVKHTPEWRAGFGYEFLERPDGYPGLAEAYGLHFGTKPRIMDLGLLYRALADRQVDLVAGNSTDGAIKALDLAVLEDDRRFFPPYEAVPIVRGATAQAHPEVVAALEKLAGKISAEEMQRMNYAVDGQGQDVAQVVRDFLQTLGLGGAK